MAAVKDRDRPLQALSLKRIIRVVELHWSEPEVLAGILHELRIRLEPEAAIQARSIARRLSILRYQLSQDTARMAAESRAAADALAVIAQAHDDSEDKKDEVMRSRRRRRLAVAAAGLAAAAAAAWFFLHPHPDATDAQAPAGPGLAVSASGRVDQPETRDGSAPPPGAAARESIRGIVASETPDSPPEAPVFEHPHPRVASLSPEAASVPPSPARAEAGVRVTDAAVDCYIADPIPDDCTAAFAATPGAVEAGDAVIPEPLPSLRAPQAPSPAADRVRPPVRPRGSPPLVAAAPPVPAVAGSQSMRAPRAADRNGDRNAPPQCASLAPVGRIVFVLDGTLSMGLPLDVDASLEDRLDEAILHHDAAARRQYRALLARPGPKRITRAREAFATAALDLPDQVDLGLVVFQECRDIRKVGTYDAPRRGKAIDYIRSLIPRGRTPIAASLRNAAEMLGAGPSSIVLMTDGRESCTGDPCAAAAEIHKAHPDTPVYVVDITGQAKAECVAEITGGRTYTPAAADDLGAVLRNAFRGVDAQCGGAAH